MSGRLARRKSNVVRFPKDERGRMKDDRAAAPEGEREKGKGKREKAKGKRASEAVRSGDRQRKFPYSRCPSDPRLTPPALSPGAVYASLVGAFTTSGTDDEQR